MYYRTAGGEQGLRYLSEAVEQTIAIVDRQEWPWRENCELNFIYDLRQTGMHEEAVERK